MLCTEANGVKHIQTLHQFPLAEAAQYTRDVVSEAMYVLQSPAAWDPYYHGWVPSPPDPRIGSTREEMGEKD